MKIIYQNLLYAAEVAQCTKYNVESCIGMKTNNGNYHKIL